ncbi:MAG: response regulator, partial [Chloroflexota bacterium]
MRKIMIVDDEAAIGRLLTYQLQGFGYEVCYVQDGLQALERVLLEQPDLILLDVMMPLVSGWDVCRQIRQSSNVPIIMLTGKNADADVVTGLQSGADDYVTKPFSVAQLHARIEAVLRRAERVPVARAQASPFGQSIGTTVAARGARETAPAFTARAGERRASTSRAST